MSYTIVAFLRRAASFSDPSSGLFHLLFIIVCFGDVAEFLSEARERYRRLVSNNSNLAADSIIQTSRRCGPVGGRGQNVLRYGKYIEYKSCQINKINVVPITIIFPTTNERNALIRAGKKKILSSAELGQ